MKDYKDYYTTINGKSSGAGSGSSPDSGSSTNIFGYFVIKAIDNGLNLVLVALLLTFLTIAMIAEKETISNFCLDSVKLVLGVFLGLFAGRKKA